MIKVIKAIEMSKHPFSLQTKGRQAVCPACGQRTFKHYLSHATGQPVADGVGRCNRENNCGYHLPPREYFKSAGIASPTLATVPNLSINPEPERPVDYLPLELVERSMAYFRQSNFARFIVDTFGKVSGEGILLQYLIGGSLIPDGEGQKTGNIFWRIDAAGNVRTGKIMYYNAETGKRRKECNPTWVHSIRREGGERLYPDFNYHLCFFGEHLIAEHPEKKIGICESEKTAVIASYFMPQYTWIATGGASGCKWREYAVYKVLEGRTVVLFPDFGFYNKKSGKTCFQEWQDRAAAITEKFNCQITVSRILENILKDRSTDSDLADVLLRVDRTKPYSYPLGAHKLKQYSHFMKNQ